MKYVKQFMVILLVSFLGELLKLLFPFPIPGSVYAMVILFMALITGILKLEQVQETALFLIEIMPVLFVPAGVGLMDSWDELQEILLPVIIILLLTTVIVMVAAGWATQGVIWFSGRRKKGLQKHV